VEFKLIFVHFMHSLVNKDSFLSMFWFWTNIYYVFSVKFYKTCFTRVSHDDFSERLIGIESDDVLYMDRLEFITNLMHNFIYSILLLNK
jgi:hypothetical protein